MPCKANCAPCRRFVTRADADWQIRYRTSERLTMTCPSRAVFRTRINAKLARAPDRCLCRAIGRRGRSEAANRHCRHPDAHRSRLGASPRTARRSDTSRPLPWRRCSSRPHTTANPVTLPHADQCFRRGRDVCSWHGPAARCGAKKWPPSGGTADQICSP